VMESQGKRLWLSWSCEICLTFVLLRMMLLCSYYEQDCRMLYGETMGFTLDFILGAPEKQLRIAAKNLNVNAMSASKPPTPLPIAGLSELFDCTLRHHTFPANSCTTCTDK
jgi:hypothetical protein